MTGESPGASGRQAPRTRPLPGQRVLNGLIRILLRTPGLCRVVGRRLVILHVVGRKSKRCYVIPVAYLREGDDLLIGTSSGWARNLRTGEQIVVRLKGKLRTASVRVGTAETEVVGAYDRMARENPTFARFNMIRLDDGEPDRTDLRLAWLHGARTIRLSPN